MDEVSKALQVLGLKPDCSEAELEEAFQERAEAWDPARFAHNEQLRADARQKLDRVHAAYQLLRAQFPTPGGASTPSLNAQINSPSQSDSTEAAVLAGKRAAFWATLATLILFILGAAWLLFWERHATVQNESTPVPAKTAPPANTASP